MMIEAYRGYVNAWECDEMSHMNIQFYVAKASDGAGILAAALALGERAKSKGTRLSILDHHIRFQREMMVSDLITIRAGIVDISDRTITLYEEMTNALTGAVTATFVVQAGHLDIASKRLVPWRDETRRKSDDLRVDLPDHAKPRGLTSERFDRAVTLERADRLGLIVSNRSICNPWECGTNGFMNPRFYMARFSECQGHLWAHIGIGRHDQAASALATATTEYRLVHFREVAAGDTIVVRTGLFGLDERTVHYKHWMFDGETGEPVAASEGIALLFDRTTRRAIVFPDEMRARMAAVLVKARDER
jgi:acyl-CoA thioester hydrolase